MALSPKLSLRQTTALVMTPRLQQAIRLLQLSNLELAAYIEEELAQNPLLEREDGLGEGAGESADPDFSGTGDAPDCAELAQSDHLPDAGEAPLDTDTSEMWDDGGRSG